MTSTSQAFVKALKGHIDPPTPHGPSKIDLAWTTWTSDHLHLPNKDEIIVDWILSTFLKERGAATTDSSPIHNVRYWSLLADIIASGHTKTTKSWLIPMLNRIPTIPIVTSLLHSFSSSGISDTALVVAFGRCITVLWPLGVPKTNIDNILDCFSSALVFVSKLQPDVENDSREAIVGVVNLVASTFRSSYSNSSNKKKLSASFIKTNLQSWLLCASAVSIGTDPRFAPLPYPEIYIAGTDVLFSPDALKSAAGPADACVPLRAVMVTLASEGHDSVLHTLPSIFNAYDTALRKNRTSIFGSSPSQSQERDLQSQVRDAGMKGFVALYEILHAAGRGQVVWKVTISLLEMLERANIVVSGVQEHLTSLKIISKWSTTALANGQSGDNASPTNAALDVLSVLTRIDYDIVSPDIPSILGYLIKTHVSSNLSSDALLRLFFEYHIKTRTLNVYVDLILACLSNLSLSTGNVSGLDNLYKTVSRSSIVSISHLEQLSKAIKGFLTPGQVSGMVLKIFESLKSTWQRFDSIASGDTLGHSDGRPKKKKRMTDTPADITEAGLAAISFSLIARLASAILPSLPLSNLSTSHLQSTVSLFTDYQTEHLGPVIQCGTGRDLAAHRSTRWSSQIISAAALRLCHAFCIPPLSTSLAVPPTTNFEVPLDSLAEFTETGAVVPELHFETLRHIFEHRHNSDGPEAAFPAWFEALLKYLETHLKPEVVTAWSGLSCDLDLTENGASCTALALWHFVLDRWLPIIDSRATPQQLYRLAELILKFFHRLGQSANAEFTAGWVIHRAVLSAGFWELPILRSALVTLIGQKLAFLDAFDLSMLLTAAVKGTLTKPKQKKKRVLVGEQINAVGAAFTFLLYCPTEYLPRSTRSDYFRRGLVADVAVWLSQCHDEDGQTEAAHDQRMRIRSWLTRMTENFGFVEMLSQYEHLVDYLIRPGCYPPSASRGLQQASIDLVQAVIRPVVRTLRSSEGRFVDCADILTELCEHAPSYSDLSQSVHSQCLLQFIYTVITEYPLSRNISAPALQSLGRLSNSLGSTLKAEVTLLASRENTLDDLKRGLPYFSAWRTHLALRRWLAGGYILTNRSTELDLGVKLLVHLIPSKTSTHPSESLDGLYGEVLALLFEELHFKEAAERRRHLQIVAAAYMSISERFAPQGCPAADTHLAQACKALNNDDITVLYDLIKEALSTNDLENDHLCALIRLSKKLAAEAPDVASKLTQEFVSGCLQVFQNSSRFGPGSANLAVQVLNLIAVQCSDRPASVPPLDVGPIWLLLANLLSGCPNHDAHTSFDVFHAIITLSSTLIRLRRDLVLSTLPLLSKVLRLLLGAMRTIRPQLGAKQSQIVTDTLPCWVSPAEPLRIEEAKALGRLLTALQTKTIARRYGSAEEKVKAESLARPLSKHAPYVLTAYIDAMNDPFCTIPSSVRKELEPGLFSLCSMMTEHGRDAVMVSALDAGGKLTLKMLWKEYEKQRYIGNG